MIKSPRLHEVFFAHDGKFADKWEQYIAIYESEFAKFIDAGKPVRLLEIGVQNGGSLEVWSRYFPAGSEFIGVDIDPRVKNLRFSSDNIRVIVADAADQDTLVQKLGEDDFDIIIDDGSHISKDIIESYNILFEKVRWGGKYIIEDMHACYWRLFQGGYLLESSAIEFFKNMVDGLNADHIIDDVVGDDKRARLESVNRSVARISFYDSVAVIEKLLIEKNEPYRRVQSGTAGQVLNPIEGIMVDPKKMTKMTLYGEASASVIEPQLIDRIEQQRLRLVELQKGLEQKTAEATSFSTQLEVSNLKGWTAEKRVLEEQALIRELREARIKDQTLLEDLTEARTKDQDLLRSLATLVEQSASERERLAHETALCREQAKTIEQSLQDYLSNDRQSLALTLSRITKSVFTRIKNKPSAAEDLSPIRTGRAADVMRDPSLFDATWYLWTNPDVQQAVTDPLQHYLEIGATEGREPNALTLVQESSLFDVAFYLSNNSDVEQSGVNPIWHYLKFGASEGRDPNAYFSTSWYLNRNNDVAALGINPLAHYIRSGGVEGRDPNPLFDSNWYFSKFPEVKEKGLNPLAHYLNILAEGKSEPFPIKRALLEAGRPFLNSDPVNSSNKIATKTNIAVVFLAWAPTSDLQGLIPFFNSYRKFPAGVDHDLIILRKGGATTPEAKRALELLMSYKDVIFIDVEDTGFDIQPYLSITDRLETEFVCFLNNYSEIRAADWLLKLNSPFADPKVGITGATASYESIKTTLSCANKAIWLTKNRPETRSELESVFPGILIDVPSIDVQAATGDGNLFDRSIDAFDDELSFRYAWASGNQYTSDAADYRPFRSFPNPHIRTNGFMMRREVLAELHVRIDNSKLQTWLFESGPEGLPVRLARNGLSSILVGADGRKFGVERWAESETFRLGDQTNVLIADNQVREFEQAPTVIKRQRSIQSWGEYNQSVPEALIRMGFPFAKDQLNLVDPSLSRRRVETVKTSPRISIVLPTRNGLHLVKQALSTIQAQNYPNWECVVYDNASEQPLEDHVKSLQDPNIRYARSASFVPVTDSWNGAIDQAKGDYVMLIGDDDGLPPNSFSDLARLAERFYNPDLFYSSHYQFMHPWVMPSQPWGYLNVLANAFFLVGQHDPVVLAPQVANFAVRGSLKFRRNFSYNMQACYFSHRLLDNLRHKGNIFHSPFPDYYLANAAFIRSRSTVIVPQPIGFQGVSRKSFGFTLLNNLPERGEALLATELSKDPLYSKVADSILDGGLAYATNFMITMHHVVDMLGDAAPCGVDMERYRRLQILAALGGVEGLTSAAGIPTEFERTAKKLTEAESAWAGRLIKLGAEAASNGNALATLYRIAENTSMYAPPQNAALVERVETGQFSSLPEVYAYLQGRWELPRRN